ncbi:DNA-processing protein DprA [Sandaracinobacter sp.]|uniref:DNA-processing protein DprA n=1 Tax=Sandaracinobacter sp. TaxID=2487581 RepID=UPI0035B4955D
MTPSISPNTQAILLLTAPLIVGKSSKNADLITPAEYRRFAKHLREIDREPSDLLTPAFGEIAEMCAPAVSPDRLTALLGRGFQLSQAIERWQARAIWVISRADPEYPARLKSCLRNDAPSVLYGCGDLSAFNRGGLAVVGSRAADEELLSYTLDVGELAARAGRAVISGGAKGIDQYAMRGALNAGGRVIGVLADSLERQAMNRDHRNMIVDGQLTLISPFDPSAGFNVGNAMQRNKSIYALSDAALVVSSDVGKGGTWAGAVEQLDKYRCVPIYVRSVGEPQPGLAALKNKGAADWPNPRDVEALDALLNQSAHNVSIRVPSLFDAQVEIADDKESRAAARPDATAREASANTEDATSLAQASLESPADAIFQAARSAIQAVLSEPKKEADVASALDVSAAQTKQWLGRMIEEGLIEKTKKPVRYRLASKKLI